ncbi:MAG: YtxH domain-containing protein [Acidobacteriaceae bacterium]|nr:YtxH domain-containing protein [Acidobacteriaceae bacterium]
MERENKRFMVAWFVSGAIIGAAAAILMAPEPGAKTRRRIAGGAERGRRTIVESGQELFEKGRDLYERGRVIAEEAAEMFERGRQIAEKTIEDRI